MLGAEIHFFPNCFNIRKDSGCVQSDGEVSQVRVDELRRWGRAEGTHPGIRLARLEFPCSSKADN